MQPGTSRVRLLVPPFGDLRGSVSKWPAAALTASPSPRRVSLSAQSWSRRHARDARRGIRAGLAPDPITGSERERHRRCSITPEAITPSPRLL